MPTWQLYIRHAHRELIDRSQDNGLSPKGRRQCERLTDYLERHFEAKQLRKILSSPKERCLETAEYVARWSGLEVQTEPRLDEQLAGESEREFRSRLKKFFNEIQEKSGHCFVSHGDVLPILAEFAGFAAAKLRKGDLFWIEDGQLRALNAVQ